MITCNRIVCVFGTALIALACQGILPHAAPCVAAAIQQDSYLASELELKIAR